MQAEPLQTRQILQNSSNQNIMVLVQNTHRQNREAQNKPTDLQSIFDKEGKYT